MATFQSRVEGLTGLSIGTSPTQSELTEYLKDGVIEVTERCILLRPQDIQNFQRSTASDSQGVSVGGARIIAVMRENGADGSSDGTTSWRECRKVSPTLQSRVVDINSLDYASTYNPVYIIENDHTINVYPTPSSNNGMKVFYVNEEPRDISSDSSLTNAHSNIKYFPNDKVYLVVLYSGIKSLQNALSAKSDDLPSNLSNIVLESYDSTLPTYTSPSSFVMPIAPAGVDLDYSSVGSVESFVVPVISIPALSTIGSMSLPSVPVTPSMSEKSVTITGTAPTYTTPVLSLTTAPTISDLSISSIPPVVPSLSDNSVSFSTTAPTFVAPVVSPDFDDANTWVNIEEDEEMLAARMQVINGQLNEYSQNIQKATQQMNKENMEYQAQLQKSIKDADLSSNDDNQKLQKYSSELNSYQAQVNKEVSQYQQNLNKEIQLFQTKRQNDLEKYGSDAQVNLNNFNKENAEYQAKLQKDLKDAQLAESKEGRELQKYSAQLNSYQAEVNKEVQRWTNEEYNIKFNEWAERYRNKLAEYNADIQKESQRVSASLNEYQAEVNKDLQKYQAETGYDISKYQAEIQAQVQKFQSDLTEKSTEFDKNIAKYSADYTRASNNNNSIISKYSGDVQNYSAKVQKVGLDYKWMTERLMKLQQEYDTAFMVMRPQQQREA